MEKSLDKYFSEKIGVEYTNPAEYSPLALAYIGDSVFDMLIKTVPVSYTHLTLPTKLEV